MKFIKDFPAFSFLSFTYFRYAHLEKKSGERPFMRKCLLLLLSCVITAAPAQSTRPGWGSIPYHDSYHDASVTGVTFRVWAPNATSVYVPGQFNNWSTTATPLAKELSNGNWTGVWSADVASASTGQQYKYYINYSGGSVWKHDPRARLVTYSGSASGANDMIY